MHTIAELLCAVTVDDQAVTQLVQELQDRDLNRVELSLSKQSVERVLHDAMVLHQEVIGEDFGEHVPAHDSEPGVSAGSEADKPAALLEVLEILGGGAAQAYLLLNVRRAIWGLERAKTPLLDDHKCTETDEEVRHASEAISQSVHANVLYEHSR